MNRRFQQLRLRLAFATVLVLTGFAAGAISP